MKTCRPFQSVLKLFALLVAALYFLTPAVSSAQRHGRASSLTLKHTAAILTVEGRVAKPLYLSATDFQSYPRSTVQVNTDSGETAVYEGVSLIEILRKAGAALGGQIKDEACTYVEAIARDGAHVIFSLSELDPALANSNVLVVDTPSSTASGHAELVLIVGTDKVRLRTVQHLATIRVRRLR